jgi:hypothetical protein
MAYWGASELSTQFPQAVVGRPLITPTSMPVNHDHLTTQNEMIGAEFEGAAAAGGYGTPIPTTATQAYSYARLVVQYGVGWWALEKITPGHKTADEYRSAYKAAIDQIREGRQPLLTDAAVGTLARELPRSGGIASPIFGASSYF